MGKLIYLLLFVITCSCLGADDDEVCVNVGNIHTCRNIQERFPNIFYGGNHLRCLSCAIPIFTNETFPFRNFLISFNVSESRIRLITGKAFSSLSNVPYIYLQNNEIQEVLPDAFWGLHDVSELHLDYNQIENLVPRVFNNLKSNTVILSHNKIKTLINNVFEGSLSISILDLSENQIKEVEAEAFLGLESLEVLHLQNNQICSIAVGVFKHLNSLRQLNLADNKISSFTLGTFSGLPRLDVLNLSNNTLSLFQGDVLLPLDGLSDLNLSGNGIYNLDINAVYMNVPTLRKLRIDDNLLSCDALKNIVWYLKGQYRSVQVVSTVGRYDVQNVYGIACIRSNLYNTMDFEQFLTDARDESLMYC